MCDNDGINDNWLLKNVCIVRFGDMCIVQFCRKHESPFYRTGFWKTEKIKNINLGPLFYKLEVELGFWFVTTRKNILKLHGFEVVTGMLWIMVSILVLHIGNRIELLFLCCKELL